jgi:hypothetical protein
MKVFEMKEEKEKREQEKEMRSKMWEEGTESLVCKPCSKYRDAPNLPADMWRFRRGRDHGMIGKYRESGERRPEREVRHGKLPTLVPQEVGRG